MNEYWIYNPEGQYFFDLNAVSYEAKQQLCSRNLGFIPMMKEQF
jgi:hypothetical protein